MATFELQYPVALLLPLLLPILLRVRRQRREKIPFPAVGPHLAGLRPGFWRANYEAILFSMAFVSLCLALANPGYSRRTVEEFIESKWIFLALDLSGSMKRLVSPESPETLGDLALDGLESFIDLRRADDYIGLVAFSSYARLLSPLTFDKQLLKNKLELVRSRNQSRIYRELGAGGGTNASEAVWLALSAFFSMLPEDSRLTVEQIAGLRQFLLSEPGTLLDIPRRLHQAGLGRGMAVILFTDGRIEPTLRTHIRSGRMPNLVNLITLMKAIGVHFYIIAVGGEIDDAVEQAMTPAYGEEPIGRIFVTSRSLDRDQIEAVYQEIDVLEANRNLSRVTFQPRWTRPWFSLLGLVLLVAHLTMRCLPAYRRL